MEYHLSAGLLSLLLFLYCLLRWKNRTSTEKTPPQPSGAWPLIGHLHLLGDLPHKSLGKLADKYGPIFMIRLGLKKALVISSPAMARECLGNNDRVFVGRPQSVFVEHLAFNSAMLGFSPYGPYWREIRKIVTVELLSNRRLEEFKDVKMSEVRSAMKIAYDNYRKSEFGSRSIMPIEMKCWFNDVSLNNIVRLIAADVFPFLRALDIGGYEKTMKNVAKDIDSVAQVWLEEHKGRRVPGEVQEKKDFMDVLMGIFQTPQENTSKFEADVIIKATSMAMILAATDTAAVTLTWAVSLLLNNKDALKKTQAELDRFVGKERKVDESDLKDLVYLQAILKETMRLYPAAPLSVPRESIADCTVNGYHIPKDTQLFLNLYKIHRDPETWQDPCEFRPERFLTTHKDYDVRGQNYDFMTFGSGRRICPGISFALQFMQFTLASLLQGFEISTPMDEMVDLTEGAGLTNLKATPLDVILTPRLPGHLYELNVVEA
ncbi:hypothetical protein RND81_01G153900 [Saponaria officinalis]|uniref:Cytochrome P450 n=1 Tax=Saponaria officinalis TaxID=3572 RepID=A0AAW1NFL6_SAPOF